MALRPILLQVRSVFVTRETRKHVGSHIFVIRYEPTSIHNCANTETELHYMLEIDVHPVDWFGLAGEEGCLLGIVTVVDVLVDFEMDRIR